MSPLLLVSYLDLEEEKKQMKEGMNGQTEGCFLIKISSKDERFLDELKKL